MEGIIIFFVIVSIITSIANAAKKTQQNNGNQRGGFSSGSAAGASNKGAYTGSVTSEQRARLEQLRRLQQQRQAAEKAASDRAAKPYQEKPTHPHDTENCGGGSIHDGYHEGTVRRPVPASSAEGRLGRQGVSEQEGRGVYELSGKDWEEKKKTRASIIPPTPDEQPVPVSTEAVNVSNKNEPSGAEKLSKAISDKPAIVQGLIWSEVLGRPLSDNR